MPKTKIYIKNFRPIILIWFILFSLSPCKVKEVVSSSMNAEYFKHLNNSKTTAPTGHCSYSQSENQHISSVKKAGINERITPHDPFNNKLFPAHFTKVPNDYSKTFSGNDPPKYILYKRLKIGAA